MPLSDSFLHKSLHYRLSRLDTTGRILYGSLGLTIIPEILVSILPGAIPFKLFFGGVVLTSTDQ